MTETTPQKKRKQREEKMGYNYGNLTGSIKENDDMEQAKNGLLPEGKYKFSVTNIEYGKETSGAKVWIFHCAVLAPNTIYHRAQRQIRFSEREDYYAKEDFKRLVSLMQCLGVDFGSMVKSLQDMQSLMGFISDAKLKFDVEVGDQVGKDGKVSKYQKFLIDEATVQALDFTDYMEERGYAKAPVAKAVPKAVVDAVVEEVADEVPPPAPKRRSPYPEPQQVD